MVSNSPRKSPESNKITIAGERHVNARRGASIMEIAPDPKTMSNKPWNGAESAKTASVDDRHINASRGSSIMEIALGPENGE